MLGDPRQIIHGLFGKDRLEEVSIGELQELVEEFPSFSAGHFLLSKKMKTIGSEAFDLETQRTALYFTNPFWLQWLLQHHDERPAPGIVEMAPIEEIQKPQESPEMLRVEEIKIETATTSFPSVHEAIQEESLHYPEETLQQAAEEVREYEFNEAPLSEPRLQIEEEENAQPVLEKTGENVYTAYDAMKEPDQDPDVLMEESLADIALSRLEEEKESPGLFQHDEVANEPASAAETLNPDHEAIVETESALKETFHEEIDQVVPETEQPHFAGQETDLETPLSASEHNIQRPFYFWEKEFYKKPESEEMVNKIPEAASANFNGENINEAAEFQEEKMEAHSVSIVHSTQPDEKTASETELVIFETDPIISSSTQPKDGEMNAPVAEEKIPENDKSAIAEIKAPQANLSPIEEELQFEPYHTIDYFASQGIKYDQEENPTDKFGKQLKSFTAWLKSMKKLPKAVLESEMSDITEAAILSIAEHSVEEKEVLTEAMAEVLVLQGKIEKAIELYEKLSLLNPSKSAFFAARIKQIKAN